MEDENIRLYVFHVPGYIPGLPRQFPGGYQAYVNTVTLDVVAEGPLNQPLPLPTTVKPVQAQNVPLASAVEVQPIDSGVAASSSFSFITDVKVGG